MTIDSVKADAEFIYQIGMKLTLFMKLNGILPIPHLVGTDFTRLSRKEKNVETPC
jgi:hypothetical protein